MIEQSTAELLPPDGADDRDRVGAALTSLRAAVTVLAGGDAASLPPPDAGGQRVDPRALAAVCRLDDLPGLFEAALGWDPDALEPYDAASLAWCLTRPALRDVALVQWCGGLDAGDEAFDAQLRWEQGEEYPVHLAMHMWGEGDAPDASRLRAGLALARRIAADVPDADRPGPLATCAWLSWALGGVDDAERYALHACDLEPEHGLAEIVLSFVHAGHVPDWAVLPGAAADSGAT